MNEMKPVQALSLSDRALLATLSISGWSARKYDRKVSDEVNTSHGASHDAGRYNKALLAKHALAEIKSIESTARAEFYHRTRPWLYNGTGILSVDGYEPFVDIFRSLRERHERAVAKFVAEFPSYVAEARQRLGELFDPADYPDPEEIAGKFVFDLRFDQVSDPNDFRANVSAEQAAMIRKDIERQTREALEEAMRGTWQRVAEAVGKMSERLAAYRPSGGPGDRAEGVFRDSLVQNVRDLVAVLPSLNLTDDPKLAATAQRMADELCGIGAETLRADPAARKSVQKAAAAILADVESYI